MIKLYQFARAFGLPNASPFCMKVECALRMAKLEYEVIDFHIPAKAPKGKLPFIDDGNCQLADSELILDYLQSHYGWNPDAGLSPQQKAVSKAFQIMLDEHLYWVFIQNRWMDPANWPGVRDSFFGWMPALVRKPLAEFVRRGLRKELYGHGMGRHSPEQIYAFGIADLQSLSDWLGDKPWFHGDTPTRADATLAAYLNNLYKAPVKASTVRDAAEKMPNLKAYADRSLREWFPDFGTDKT